MARRRVIRLFDDQSEATRLWQKQLREIDAVNDRFVVEAVDQDAFERDIGVLTDRRRRAREEGRYASDDGAETFDETDVLVVDYDLMYLEDDDYFLTGEEVAYLARAYSRCGVIVALNQFSSEIAFDLSLTPPTESFADLNLSTDDLSKPGLWQNGWSGYRPWRWPLLPMTAQRLERRVRDVLAAGLDANVLDFFAIPDRVRASLSRRALSFLEGSCPAEEVTFETFVLESGHGLHPKDEPANDEWVARVAAARLSFWLDQVVLPSQNVLVDAPHLALRYPSLLAGEVDDPGTWDDDTERAWNRTARFDTVGKVGIRWRKLRDHVFPKAQWLSRPAWFWPLVSEDERIDEVSEPWLSKRPEIVFCEDLSRFLPRGLAREFVADVPGSYARRYVADRVKMADDDLRQELGRVRYRPMSQFAL